MDIQSIIDKIQKLQALSKSPANENEALAATAIANKLIDQYRLSQAELEIKGEVEEPLEEDGSFIYESGKVTVWKLDLVHVLVKHYGLSVWNNRTFKTGRQVSRFKLVGRKSDIDVAKYMFSWLVLQCQQLADKEAKGKGRVYIASYCSGFVNGVSFQLKLSRSDVQKETSSAAIVKIDERGLASKKFMNELHSNLIMSKPLGGGHLNYNAFDKGQIKGKNIHLGSSLDANNSKLLNK